MERVSLTIDQVERVYWLFRAPDLAINSATPLLIALHGTGGTALWANDEAGWSAFAATAGYHLAIPEGRTIIPDRPPKFLTNPQRWNDGATRPGDPLHSDVDDVKFLDAVIDDAIERVGCDSRRIFLTGFSNGAGMAFRYASERANKLAAVVPVAGYCWVEPQPARPLPTLYMLGMHDPLIPYRGGPIRFPWTGKLVQRPSVIATLERWAAAIGCQTTSEIVYNEQGIREERFPVLSADVELRAVFIEGLGHHWPGGKGQLSERIGGKISHHFQANERIWAFCRPIQRP